MGESPDGWARVRVPATSANLGPGFDALGLALDLRDEVAVRLTGPGMSVHVEGEGAGTVSRDDTNLVVSSLLSTAAGLGLDVPGLELRAVNRIPHGRGLGSSAAAICAGVVLAHRLAGVTDRDVGLATACALEGHPDNVAACLLGGLTIARSGPDGAARATRLEPVAGLRPVVLVPPGEASTREARAALPDTVPHADAAFTAGRAALLMAALTVEPGLLFEATEDRLHQPYRASGQPATAALVAELRSLGLAAVVSGAGPTVLVLTRDDAEAARSQALAPAGWQAWRLPIAGGGAWAT